MSNRANTLDFSAKRAFPKTEQYGDFVAEFFTDKKSDPPLYHYIITRVGQREILTWGQELSEAGAHASARIAAHSLVVRGEDAG
jgi:hypothetical protein